MSIGTGTGGAGGVRTPTISTCNMTRGLAREAFDNDPATAKAYNHILVMCLEEVAAPDDCEMIRIRTH